MFCTIDDCGLSYSSEALSDIVDKLHSYITENYGRNYVVTKVNTGAKYSNCKLITSPGEYIVHCSGHKKDIYCTVR